MINIPTTFILGAGASVDYLYPSGVGLMERVVRQLKTPGGPEWKALLDLGHRKAHLSKFADDLYLSGRSSVDAFLEHRRDYIEVGKDAMAYILVQFEELVTLFRIQDNWYQYLFENMNAPFERFSENRLSIITFNYDRSFETYFFNALQKSYKKNDSEVADVLRRIPIVHVYGKLGELPWQSANGREYSPTQHLGRIRDAASGIRIIHETDNVDQVFAEARQILQATKRIIFLGFGYHKINLQRLNMGQLKGVEIFGSCLGLTDVEHISVGREFKPNRITLKGRGWRNIEFLREMISL
jgi:hypothetical protein